MMLPKIGDERKHPIVLAARKMEAALANLLESATVSAKDAWAIGYWQPKPNPTSNKPVRMTIGIDVQPKMPNPKPTPMCERNKTEFVP